MSGPNQTEQQFAIGKIVAVAVRRIRDEAMVASPGQLHLDESIAARVVHESIQEAIGGAK